MTILQDLIEEDFGIEGRNRWMHSLDHDSLVYDRDNDIFFWNSQGIRGNVTDYLTKVRGLDKAQAKDFLKNFFGAFKENFENRITSRPYDRLIDVFWVNGVDNREYWYKRCLTDDTIDRRKLGFYDGWNVIPIYEDGDFVNFQKRRDIPDKKIHFWYRAGKVYLYNDGVLPFTKKVYITEGLVDCILMNQEGFPCVCATGVNTWQNDWLAKFFNINEIVYFADNDAAGLLGAKLVANNLGVNRVKIVTFPDKEEKYDLGNYFQDGGTKESLAKYISETAQYIFEMAIPERKEWKR